ncbi:UNVERIFIED_CONTAM: Retrovirus-related Pol polyprotein from transposon TNT 1-94 [Sesamum latifolium]|uniref:Retrovirus-related Pol polyprotein from transposon TNT 1-94 n=1 Tax=Sesamum latifolium TaxID=2727402 RepID=A0AAW2TN86_9LAMI
MAKSIWILLAIAYDYQIWQMNVKIAFLNGFVEEEIYIDQPEDFTSVGEEQKVCAGEAHWSAVKTIIRSLKRTKDMFLIYGGGELTLEGYNDALQSDDDHAKSQSGYVFKLNGGVVAWKSSKQAIAVDSTTESEYIAASEAAKEAVWMKNYI